MTTLAITRGYPASGKTTVALKWLAEDPDKRYRLNRDDSRATNGFDGIGSNDQERHVTIAEMAALRALLENGVSVIVDATNLRLKYAREFANLAVALGVDFEVIDVPTPLEECLRNNEFRRNAGGRYVPESAIRKMAKSFPLKAWVGKPIEPVPDVAPKCEPYAPNEKLPRAWICDIDGTLAHMNGRNPFDYGRVHEDSADEVVSYIVNKLGVDDKIIVMSGRDDSCRDVTIKWLDDNRIPFDEIYMRKTGDMRRDSIVKAELFDAHVRNRFNVIGVLDDRDQVVNFWRSIGLKCLQVEPGDF